MDRLPEFRDESGEHADTDMLYMMVSDVVRVLADRNQRSAEDELEFIKGKIIWELEMKDNLEGGEKNG